MECRTMKNPKGRVTRLGGICFYDLESVGIVLFPLVSTHLYQLE